MGYPVYSQQLFSASPFVSAINVLCPLDTTMIVKEICAYTGAADPLDASRLILHDYSTHAEIARYVNELPVSSFFKESRFMVFQGTLVGPIGFEIVPENGIWDISIYGYMIGGVCPIVPDVVD